MKTGASDNDTNGLLKLETKKTLWSMAPCEAVLNFETSFLLAEKFLAASSGL